MVSEKEVLIALNGTGDPEIGIGIVDLGLVANLSVVDGFVMVRLRMTTPRCPFQPFIMLEAHNKLIELSGVSGVEIETTSDSPWHPEMMSEDAKQRLGYAPPHAHGEKELVPEIQVQVTKAMR
jgi:metal-sulfur cluster biosynthetic enzyme